MSRVFRALLKKQMMELFNSFSARRGGKKNSGKKSFILYIILILFGFFGFCMIFLMAASAMFDVLHGAGADWLYFSLMSLMGMMLAIVGSAFMTYSTIYKAKDNETLLSMPIPQGMILMSRMCGCYIISLVFGALPLLPALFIWCVNGMASALSVIFTILTIFILPLISLAVSCLLGWVIALIAPHVRNKSLVTTLVSVLFLAAYFIFYTNASSFLQSLLDHAADAEAVIRSWVFPIYMLGRGMTGEIVPYLLFVLCAAVIFGIVLFAMSKSFLSLATASGKVKKTVYREKMVGAASPRKALLRRELFHYKSSPAYILNCTMGTMFMLVMAVFAVVQTGRLREVISNIGEGVSGISLLLPLISGGVIAMMVSYNLITVPSVSLEGRSIWLVKSLPVATREILDSKILFHLILTLPVSVLTHIVICAAAGADPAGTASSLLFVVVYNFASAALGMIIALKMPNLNYTDEASAIKQNWGVTIVMFGGMIAVAVLAFLYFIVSSFIPAWLFAVLASLLFAGLSAIEFRWIYTRGIIIFEEL